ncbi:MAG: cytochrome P450, partial [Ktedonobacterales bacterium]
YRTMRASSPVARDARRGVVSVFGYDDVQRVLSDYAAFSSRFGGDGTDPEQPIGASIISTDPPRHRQLRNLATQAFTPRAVAQLAPRITAIVDELLAAVAPTGRMDVIGYLAYPLPVIVIAELLGIPPEDRARFKQWSDAVVTGTHDTDAGNLDSQKSDPHGQMSAYFREMIAQRQGSHHSVSPVATERSKSDDGMSREPKDDLISNLLAAQIDGQHLTEMELIGFCTLLLIAGNETTTNLLGNAILCFDENPDAARQLTEQPDLLPTAIEEVLRYRSPVQMMFRHAVADTTIRDQPVRKGETLIAWIGSANRDEAQFPDVDRFDIARNPNRHLAFGYGIHFCLGAPLARLEAKIALGAMLERLPNMRRVPGPLEPMGSSIVFGVRALPITFDPDSSFI